MAATFTLDEAKDLLRAARTPAVLDPAKTAVLDALRAMSGQHLLSDADAADFAAAINGFRDAFELDEWVFRQPLFKGRICNYPLCFHAPRPPSADQRDGQRSGGNPPAYCAGTNERFQPHAISQNALRRREKLREAAAALAPDNSHGAAPTDQRSTAARSNFAAGVDRVEQQFADLGEEVRALRTCVDQATDDEVIRGEIEAVRLQRDEAVAHEARLRVAAETEAREATENAQRLGADNEQLRAAYNEVERLAATAAADRLAVLAALPGVISAVRAAADRAVTEAHVSADQRVAQAQAAFEEDLATRQAQMDADVQAAQAAAIQLLAEHKETSTALLSAAEQKVSEAEQKAVAAEASSTEQRARADQLADTNALLQQAAVQREQEMQTTLAEIDKTNRAAAEKLQSTIHQLRERYEKETADLRDKAVAREREFEQDTQRLRAEAAAELNDRLGQAAETAERMHAAEIRARDTAIESLTLQLQAAQNELARRNGE